MGVPPWVIAWPRATFQRYPAPLHAHRSSGQWNAPPVIVKCEVIGFETFQEPKAEIALGGY